MRRAFYIMMNDCSLMNICEQHEGSTYMSIFYF